MRKYNLVAIVLFVALGIGVGKIKSPIYVSVDSFIFGDDGWFAMHKFPISTGRDLQMANPAALYCKEVLGYEYRVSVQPDGSQIGECILPSGDSCEEWAFYAGQCGAEYSFCARQGYKMMTRHNDEDPYAKWYAVCIDNGRNVGPVGEISGLYGIIAEYFPVYSLDGENPIHEEEGLGDKRPVQIALPSSFDWRSYQGGNWLTPVKDQGSCGSC